MLPATRIFQANMNPELSMNADSGPWQASLPRVCVAKLDQTVLFGLAGLLIWIPIPLGSNREWSWSALSAAVGVLACLFGIRSALEVNCSDKRMKLPFVSVGLCSFAVAWGAIQAWVPVPFGWANPTRIASMQLEGFSVEGLIAADPHNAAGGVMRAIAYGLILLLAVYYGRSSRNAKILLWSTFVGATICTLHGLLARAGMQIVSINDVAPTVEKFSGTFVNRNNYAMYAAITAVAASVFAIDAFALPMSVRGSSMSRIWRYRLNAFLGLPGLSVGVAIVAVLGVMLSGSRGGAISLGAALIVAVALLSRYKAAGIGVCIVVLATLALSLPHAESLIYRFLGDGLVDLGRRRLFEITATAIESRPLLGWGLSSFPEIYKVLQPVDLVDYFDKAHNSYLEMAFDLGIPQALAIVIAIGNIAWRSLVGSVTRRRNRGLAAVGFCTTVAVAIQSWVDFGLQIPAIAATYFAIYGVALPIISLFRQVALQFQDPVRATISVKHQPLWKTLLSVRASFAAAAFLNILGALLLGISKAVNLPYLGVLLERMPQWCIAFLPIYGLGFFLFLLVAIYYGFSRIATWPLISVVGIFSVLCLIADLTVQLTLPVVIICAFLASVSVFLLGLLNDHRQST
jgi:O-antigen ligase